MHRQEICTYKHRRNIHIGQAFICALQTMVLVMQLVHSLTNADVVAGSRWYKLPQWLAIRHSKLPPRLRDHNLQHPVLQVLCE